MAVANHSAHNWDGFEVSLRLDPSTINDSPPNRFSNISLRYQETLYQSYAISPRQSNVMHIPMSVSEAKSEKQTL
jgi:hypothetical protein